MLNLLEFILDKFLLSINFIMYFSVLGSSETYMLCHLCLFILIYIYFFCYFVGPSAGSLDEAWFDTVAKFESDCDDDFQSVQDGKIFADIRCLFYR